jgi:S-formylglutathione hydrolase FrmB
MRISHLAILTYALIGADSSDEGQAPATVNVAPAAVVQVPSPSLNESRSVTVLLPADYAQSGKRYPVPYLLHGGGQDHTAFAARSWFAAQASRGMIIVTPNAGESWYVNSVIQPKAKYEDFVVKDLVSYVDASSRRLAHRDLPSAWHAIRSRCSPPSRSSQCRCCIWRVATRISSSSTIGASSSD